MSGMGRLTRGSEHDRRDRWRDRHPDEPPARDQEAEVRARLYARPSTTERTVEVLGPVPRIADRPAA